LPLHERPHAILLHAEKGLGQQALAQALIARWMCESAVGDATACGSCRACRFLVTGTHPDFCTIKPEEKGVIKIEAVRALIEMIAKTPQYAPMRIVLIEDAHCMNQASANALLKTLEEPPNSTLFLLETDDISALPLTVRSRCEKYCIAQPPEAVVRDWLAQQRSLSADALRDLMMMSHGAPLRALSMLDQGLVEKYKNFSADLSRLLDAPDYFFTVVERWCKEEWSLLLELWWYALENAFFQVTLDSPSFLNITKTSLTIPTLLELQTAWWDAARAHREKNHWNIQLWLEHLLLEWQKLGARYTP
jgi:DNA polymerase-3 subunit delta'